MSLWAVFDPNFLDFFDWDSEVYLSSTENVYKMYRTFSVWEPNLGLKVNKPRLPIQFEKFATQKKSRI